MLIEERNEIFIRYQKSFFLQTFLIIKKGKNAIAAKNILQNKTTIAEVAVTVARAIITENDQRTTVDKRAITALEDLLIKFNYR